MKRFTSAEDYFNYHSEKGKILLELRNILVTCGLTEEIKWGAPCYTFNKKNVAGLASFKSYTGLWFYKGSLMADDAGVLINAQEGVTKALRQWRFDETTNLDVDLIKSYILEAIEIEKKQIELPREKTTVFGIPSVLEDKFMQDKELKAAFASFTPFKQKEFVEHISSAKREATKLSRMQKVIELIRKGEGLNDKYRK